MPITILDYVKSQIGDKDTYTGTEIASCGFEMTGGCEICLATIAVYNAYPSHSGYWRCADCLADTGYSNIPEFKASLDVIACPGCGEFEDIREIRASDERTEGYSFECGECGSVWTE
jgi:predicted RNA-binding Zn-ribbon protein involved in translation (DUF1610 family)